jgi:ribosomal-protein-alanine acetyltransferase
MRESDVERVASIQQGSPESAQWQAEDYLGFETWVAEVGGQVVGFLALRETGGGEAEVLSVAVDGAWRRRGVARAMMGIVLEGRFEEVYLEVRESNQGARGLYQSIGFREVGVRPNYYERPQEAGIVMKLQK